MGGHNKTMRNLICILKDKASFIRAALSIKRAASSVHVAVLRVTTHCSSSPPPEHRLSAVLSLGNGSRPTACACVAAIMDRLHGTRDAYVALKCLITIHHVIARGSFILRDQLSFYPSAGGRNFLNFSRFRDGRDSETWGLSSWVRWYAGVLEFNLTASRVLGTFVSSSSRKNDENNREESGITSSADSDLLKELDVLVGLIEEICNAPDSLHLRQNNLVYEIMNLVAEDYRSTQYLILIRLGEFGQRIGGLSSSESTELTRCVQRLEDCRKKLSLLFVNRKRNDAFWELVTETKLKLAKAEGERGRERWLLRVGRREDGHESTRFGERVVRTSQLLMLPYVGGEWLGVVDRVNIAAPPAIVA